MKYCWHDWMVVKCKTKKDIIEDVLFKFCEDNIDYKFIKKFSIQVEKEIRFIHLWCNVYKHYNILMCFKCEKIKDEIKKEFDVQYNILTDKLKMFKKNIDALEKYSKIGGIKCNMF